MDYFGQEDWWPRKNIILDLDAFNYTRLSKTRLWHWNNVRNVLGQRHLGTFELREALCQFTRRITALSWHPKNPHMCAAACKGGAIILVRGRRDEVNNELEFTPHLISKGTGPGGAVFSVKFGDDFKMYTAGLDCTINQIDLTTHLNNEKKHKPFKQYFDTGDYNHWFTGMDISESTATLLAGDNKGFVRLFHLKSGDLVETLKLHKHKIHHCEFNPKVPHLIVTASLDKENAVKLWDLRKLKEQEPLATLPHEKGVNCATFNPVDGSRLLTTDQNDEIRVYAGPLFDSKPILTLDHPHKQFQHLTQMCAQWHPLLDVIVVGRYPKYNKSEPKNILPRPIEFFDGVRGEKVGELHHPSNDIVSLNSFNNTGEYLASGMGRNLILWASSNKLEELSEAKLNLKNKKTMKIPDSVRNALRGQNGNLDDENDENDEDDNPDDDIDAQKKKQKRKTAPASKKATTQTKQEEKRQAKRVKLSLKPEPEKKAKTSKKSSKK